VSQRDDLCAGIDHFDDGTFSIARGEIDGAASIQEHTNRKAFAEGVEYGGFHAVVGRESSDVEGMDAELAQHEGEGSTLGIDALKRGVAILGRVHAFGDDLCAV
jgi:hypothetical protein